MRVFALYLCLSWWRGPKQVINFALLVWKTRPLKNRHPLNSFFWEKMSKPDAKVQALDRWLKRDGVRDAAAAAAAARVCVAPSNLYALLLLLLLCAQVDVKTVGSLLFPIHSHIHWTLVDMDLKEHVIRYFDSTHSSVPDTGMPVRCLHPPIPYDNASYVGLNCAELASLLMLRLSLFCLPCLLELALCCAHPCSACAGWCQACKATTRRGAWRTCGRSTGKWASPSPRRPTALTVACSCSKTCGAHWRGRSWTSHRYTRLITRRVAVVAAGRVHSP